MKITRADVHLHMDTRPTKEILAGLKHYGNVAGEGFEHACYYQAYVGIAKAAKPRSVLEIGVKHGYSLVSMLRGYSGITCIVGLDLQTYYPDSQRLARENLWAAGYRDRLELPVASSHGYSKKFEPLALFDLVHVDGDHTYEGACQDIAEYWPRVQKGGVMIVDDLQCWDVMKAILDTVPGCPGVTDRFYVPTGTGWIVVVK